MKNNLSPHFSIEELTATSTGLQNVPGGKEFLNLKLLAWDVLEPIRELLGVPLKINSGYRSRAVNSAVGGARASAHLEGRAADFKPSGDVLISFQFEKIGKSQIPFDRAILEKRGGAEWIHIEIPRSGAPPRRLLYQAQEIDGQMEFRQVRYGQG